MWQTWVVIVVLVFAVIYAARRLYITMTYRESACDGCALAKNCAKRQKNRGKICQCGEK